MARLLEKYQSEIISDLKTKTGRENVLSLPRLQKIVVSMGLGKSLGVKEHLDEAMKDLATITGQQPVITRAKLLPDFRHSSVDISHRGRPVGIDLDVFRHGLLLLEAARPKEKW